MDHVSLSRRGAAADSFVNGSVGVHNMSQFKIMSSNIEGLSELKENEIVEYMSGFEIDVCCLQETRKSKSDVYTSNGAWFILSDGAHGSPEWYEWDLLSPGDSGNTFVAFAK